MLLLRSPLNRRPCQAVGLERLCRNSPIDIAVRAQVPTVKVSHPFLIVFSAMNPVPLNDFAHGSHFRHASFQENDISDSDAPHSGDMFISAHECDPMTDEPVSVITPLRSRRNLPVFFAHIDMLLCARLLFNRPSVRISNHANPTPKPFHTRRLRFSAPFGQHANSEATSRTGMETHLMIFVTIRNIVSPSPQHPNAAQRSLPRLPGFFPPHST